MHAYLSHIYYLTWFIIFILLAFLRRNWFHKIFDKAVIYSQRLNSQSRKVLYHSHIFCFRSEGHRHPDLDVRNIIIVITQIHGKNVSNQMFQSNQNVAIFKLTSRCVLFSGIIKKLFFLEFQKVLHLLTEIKDGIESVANLLKVDSVSFRLTQYHNLDEICEFDRSLTDKTSEINIVSVQTFY